MLMKYSRLVLLLLLVSVEARLSYVARIPNAGNVPNPCWGSQSFYVAIGHLNPAGDGVRNQFGTDFWDNSVSWNPALCQMDSDGDGMTNGQELGDPNCTWIQGNPDPVASTITHPGICTPIDSSICQPLNPCEYVVHAGASESSISLAICVLIAVLSLLAFKIL